MIKISVIIPVYNREEYIRECLESVLAQTLKEIEIICIDDGSTDKSYKILMEYSKKHMNVIVFHQENQGVSFARNKGIGNAKGKYICFMDSDDYYAHDQVLEKLYEAAEKNSVLVCGGGVISVTENGEEKWPRKQFCEKGIISFKNYGSIYYFTSYIYSLKMIRDNNILFPPYKMYEDPPFLLNAMIYAQEFFAVDEWVYVYRMRYKKKAASFDMAQDLLKGIRDCFRMAYETDLKKVYEEQLQNSMQEYLEVIYPYAIRGEKEIWDLIFEINRIGSRWMQRKSEIFLSKSTLEEHIVDQKNKRLQMLTECRKAESVVIYGAGVAGRYFLYNYGKECKHISGFAVSKKEKEESIEGYEVKEIQDYSRESLVIVTVGMQSAEEILQKLKELQFKRVCYVEYKALKLIDKLC